METGPRPGFRPTEILWELCLKLAEKYRVEPKDVLQNIIRAGEEVAQVEEEGGVVVGKIGGTLKQISAVKPNGKTS